MYPLPLLQQSRWETEVGLKRVIRAWYGESRKSAAEKEQLAELERLAAAKLERLRAKRREERHQRKIKNQAARHQDDGVDGAAAADGAGDGAVAPMSLDGAAAADGAADGAVAPVSLEKERRRQEAVEHLLLDWTDKARLERDKARLQAEKAGLERDKEKLRFDQAKFWGMLMEECGQEPTATKPRAPLLLMPGEACLIL